MNGLSAVITHSLTTSDRDDFLPTEREEAGGTWAKLAQPTAAAATATAAAAEGYPRVVIGT